MLMNGGRFGEARLLGPRTVAYMLSDQLGAEHQEPASATPIRPAPITDSALASPCGRSQAWSG